MDDTDTPDPFLQQVPLIRNPAFQPPKPVSLSTNYAKLLATLPGSVVPPKVALSQQDLEAWIAELHLLRKTSDPEERLSHLHLYNDWLAQLQRKVAPGFDFETMTPLDAGSVHASLQQDTIERPLSPTSGLGKDLDDLKIT